MWGLCKAHDKQKNHVESSPTLYQEALWIANGIGRGRCGSTRLARKWKWLTLLPFVGLSSHALLWACVLLAVRQRRQPLSPKITRILYTKIYSSSISTKMMLNSETKEGYTCCTDHLFLTAIKETKIARQIWPRKLQLLQQGASIFADMPVNSCKWIQIQEAVFFISRWSNDLGPIPSPSLLTMGVLS
jgi:hypothetical protein